MEKNYVDKNLPTIKKKIEVIFTEKKSSYRNLDSLTWFNFVMVVWFRPKSIFTIAPDASKNDVVFTSGQK